jgi:hypothetical protein
MSEISARLTFISDPGHGWLKIPLPEIAALGIEGQISPYSFIEGEFAYLEEDCDCTRYLEARETQGLPRPEIAEQYVEQFSRDRPRFGDLQFSPEFWGKLRR